MTGMNRVSCIKRVSKSGTSMCINFTKEGRALGLIEGDMVECTFSKPVASNITGVPFHEQHLGRDGSLKISKEDSDALKEGDLVAMCASDEVLYLFGRYEDEIPFHEGMELMGADKIVRIDKDEKGRNVMTVVPSRTGAMIEYSMFDVLLGSSTVSRGLIIRSDPCEIWEPVLKMKEE